jgi:uncharacterized protein YbjT (DUF2867 family)
MTDPVLVTCASGKLGREVVRQLRAAGYRVRCASRNPERLEDGVRFDWTNPLSWRPAVMGAPQVFLTARPLDIAAAAILPDFIDLCREAGVQHVIFSSALGTDVQPAGPLGLVESYLRHSGLTWSILRPNFFMENFSHGWLLPDIAAHGTISLPAGSGRTSFISVRDVAAVAVEVFSEPELRGHAYDLTGDDPMSHTAVAAALTRASQRPVNYHPIEPSQMREKGRRAGMPGGQLEYLMVMYRQVRAGKSAKTYNTVAKLLGRKPTSFEAFAEENAAAWRVSADAVRS